MFSLVWKRRLLRAADEFLRLQHADSRHFPGHGGGWPQQWLCALAASAFKTLQNFVDTHFCARGVIKKWF